MSIAHREVLMSIREELQRIYDTYGDAYRSQDAAGCAAVFTEDGAVYSPYSPPAIGREAVQALHVVWTQLGGEDKRLTVIDAGCSGHLAWCLTAYSDAHDSGTSLNVFERQADGAWLIRMCSLNEERPSGGQ
jgi:ketosteroid isomerase-like protein